MNNKLLEYFNGDDLAASTWQNKYAFSGEETLMICIKGWQENLQN